MPSMTEFDAEMPPFVCALLITPLLFARLAIVVSIHLDVRAISQEKLRLGARSHLRAMGPTIAIKRCGGHWNAGFSCGYRIDGFCRGYWITGFCCGYRIAGLGFGYGLWIHAAGVFAITVGTQGDQKDKWNDASEQAWFVAAITGHAQAVESFSRAA